jgi:alpha-glucosidase
MENVRIPPEFVQDPPAVNYPELADRVGRDPERTPMQWDASPNAGFTGPGVTPWLPLADDYRMRNVSVQQRDPHSMLNLYRALSALRRSTPALHGGDYLSVDVISDDPFRDDVYAYIRSVSDGESFLVVLNFGDQPRIVDAGGVGENYATIAISTGMDRVGRANLARLTLRPNEGLVLRLG